MGGVYCVLLKGDGKEVGILLASVSKRKQRGFERIGWEWLRG